ncbi:hypothetical protein PVAP13_4NG052600 [Panicum virgatum]|uniref:Uncharacterized protein n=1 Tax=Panicum virgatum TaxID=38727 RepID=A0A8T0T772_PANVG|nr:hypothetical protein PVAP13_4NG052600 [Panicum virgatum]
MAIILMRSLAAMASPSPAVSSLLGSLLLLTGSSIMAILKSSGDAAAASFVAASDTGLLLLLYCLRWFEAAHGSASRDRARRGVWLTTTLLTAMFTWRVAALVPWPVVAAGVCFMGASTVAGGFYALFLGPN